MPTNYIKSLSKKHNIKSKELEKLWDEAKKEARNPKAFGLITLIFKNKINKKYNLNENRIEKFIKEKIYFEKD